MFLSILSFIVFISILVLVHELGHFIAARRAGIWVEEFGFGIPPRIFGIKRGGTIYSINLFPFGGFVRLHGEDDEGKIKKPMEAFINKSWGTRFLIVIAGVIMNVVLAILAFSVVYTVIGIPRPVETGEVRIIEIVPGSPAENFGLKVGDVVKKVGETQVFVSGNLSGEVNKYKGEEVLLTIVRDNTESEVLVVPNKETGVGEGALGVGITSTRIESHFPPLWQRPFYGVWYGLKEAFFWGSVIVLGLFQMIWHLFQGRVPTDIVGPTGLYAVTTEVSKQGIIAVVNWMGIISINLAVLNIMPFPALDGGRAAFLLLEKAFGKKVRPKIEGWFHMVGLVLLISLIAAITFREVRMISQLGLSGYISAITGGQGI